MANKDLVAKIATNMRLEEETAVDMYDGVRNWDEILLRHSIADDYCACDRDGVGDAVASVWLIADASVWLIGGRCTRVADSRCTRVADSRCTQWRRCVADSRFVRWFA